MMVSNRWVGVGAALCLVGCGGAAVHTNDPNSAATVATSPATQSPAPATQSPLVTSAPPPTAGSATLSWQPPTLNTDGTPLADLAGYHIFYGESPNSLTQSIVVAGASAVSYEITGLTAGTWYFAVAADAADGTESALSEVTSKTI
jgi:hypothetical protein